MLCIILNNYNTKTNQNWYFVRLKKTGSFWKISIRKLSPCVIYFVCKKSCVSLLRDLTSFRFLIFLLYNLQTQSRNLLVVKVFTFQLNMLNICFFFWEWNRTKLLFLIQQNNSIPLRVKTREKILCKLNKIYWVSARENNPTTHTVGYHGGEGEVFRKKCLFHKPYIISSKRFFYLG